MKGSEKRHCICFVNAYTDWSHVSTGNGLGFMTDIVLDIIFMQSYCVANV